MAQRIPIVISYGTHYIKVAYFDPRRNQPVIVLDQYVNSCFPAAIQFLPNPVDGHHSIFGDLALHSPNQEYCVRWVKKFIGRRFTDITQQEIDQYPHPIQQRNDGFVEIVIPDPDPAASNHQLVFTPEELIALQLQHVRDIVMRSLPNADFNNVIMTVPYSFDEIRRTAMVNAFRIAGLTVTAIVNENTAEFIEYQEIARRENENVMVIDFGEEMNVSIMRRRGERIEILGHDSNDNLMSEIEETMMEIILEKLEDFEIENLEKFRIGHKERMKLKKEAERAKIELSSNEYCEVELERLIQEEEVGYYEVVVSRHEVEDRMEGHDIYDRIRDCIEQSMRQAGVNRNGIRTVIINGGGARFPLVREIISHELERANIFNDVHYDPINSVVFGADRIGDDLIVANKPIGETITETIYRSIVFEDDQDVITFISRTSYNLPIHWEHSVRTTRDNQTQMNIGLFRCENRNVHLKEYIGIYQIRNIPALPRGEIDIRISVDIAPTGFVNVTAHYRDEHGNQVALDVLIQGGFNDQDIQQMINHIGPFF